VPFSPPDAKGSTEPPDSGDRYNRQEILPGVGKEGQKKWAEAKVLVAGEGPALQAGVTALASTGVNKLFILNSPSPNSAFPQFQTSGRQMQILPPDSKEFPDTSLAVVLSENAGFRHQLNRTFRKKPRPVLYGWPAGSGYALFFTNYGGDSSKVACPCLECFEVMNPKAFSKGTPAVQRLLGAAAVSEALLWILKPETPLLNKVWITSLDEGVSYHHEVSATYKCPACMIEEGAPITP